MRLVAALAVSTLSIAPAVAADYLRGPLPEPAARAGVSSPYDWSGAYAGGHFNFGSSRFNNADLLTPAASTAISSSELSTHLGTTNAFGNANGNKGGYGGYIGYNTMWDDVVVGLEGEYTRADVRATSSSTLVGTLTSTAVTNGYFNYNTTLTGRTTINDYFAVKARAGWAIDRLLLFASLGVARATVTRETGASGTWELYSSPPRTPVSGLVTAAGGWKSTYAKWGFVAGLGAEYALTDNVILRGDWQYLGIGSANGGKNGYHTMNTVRAGANIKF